MINPKSLLKSEITNFLNIAESTAYEPEKQTTFGVTLMESIEGQLKPSTQD